MAGRNLLNKYLSIKSGFGVFIYSKSVVCIWLSKFGCKNDFSWPIAYQEFFTMS